MLSHRSSVRGWIFPTLIIVFLYIPLILKGGIIADDWGDILESRSCNNFWQCYTDWFPLFSNRPLAPLPITLTTRLFGTHYFWYLLTNSAIYIGSLLITANALHSFLNPLARQIFFVIAAVPCIAMPVIISPINQLTATVAFLYWAISLTLLIEYCQSKIRLYYYGAYVILLCGFLTYEIILPLLFFTAFLPACIDSKPLSKGLLSYFLQFITPIMIVLLIVLVWQKGLAPQWMEVYSRLNFNSAHLTRNLFTWIHLFLAQIPSLFIKSISYFSFETFAIGALLGGIFWDGVKQNNLKNIPSTHQNEKMNGVPLFLVSTGALLSSSLIFILTDESAVSWGYQARGLSSTWYALAIWLASMVQLSASFSIHVRTFILALTLLFTCFSTFSFAIQRDKYIESWNLQLHILNDVDRLMRIQNFDSSTSIIFNVPRYVPNQYNRELVFSQSWDLPAAINIVTNQKIRSGIVIDSRGKDLQGLRIESNRALVNDGGQVEFTNLWLYDFDPKIQKGALTPLESPARLHEQITAWSNN